MGLLWWLNDKESACCAGEAGDTHWIPGSERSPGAGNSNPLQYSCLGNPGDRGAWRATVHGVTRVGHNLVTKPPQPPPRLNILSYVDFYVHGMFMSCAHFSDWDVRFFAVILKKNVSLGNNFTLTKSCKELV